MSSNKEILFVSSLDPYSKEIYQILVKSNILNNFQLVDVDKYKNKLPSVIKKVPCIFTKEKKVIEGDAIEPYIQKFIHSIQSSSTNSHGSHGHGNIPGQVGEVGDYSSMEMNGNYSSQYEYLDDFKQMEAGIQTGFSLLNEVPNEPSSSSQQQNQPTQKPSPPKLTGMDALMANRQQDINSILSSQQRPLG